MPKKAEAIGDRARSWDVGLTQLPENKRQMSL